jgi:uncharacterized Zn finger protein
MYFDGWAPYVSVAERRRRAAREMEKLRKKGHPVAPVVIEGRTIARTFWGKAWCDNLESYSDFASRMPRGRSYVRNGSVVDLQIAKGLVTAIVSGSRIYEVAVEIDAINKKRWRSLIRESAGRIGSMIELLQGRFSEDVMQTLAQPKSGLFPAPSEIRLSCTCPDWAIMCKHVAAALYGVGARLDREPEIFFTLRQVDQAELISEAASARSLVSRKRPSGKKTLARGDLSEIFGIELDNDSRGRRPRVIAAKSAKKVPRSTPTRAK